MDKSQEIGILLDEWKKNIDLHVHHDNMKQQRIRHFIAMQAFMLAAFILSMRESIVHKNGVLASASLLVSILAVFLCINMTKIDSRAYDFIKFIKSNIISIEFLNMERANIALVRTYSIQHHVLYTGRLQYAEDANGTIRLVEVKRENIETASGREGEMLQYFIAIWSVFLAISFINYAKIIM